MRTKLGISSVFLALLSTTAAFTPSSCGLSTSSNVAKRQPGRLVIEASKLNNRNKILKHQHLPTTRTCSSSVLLMSFLPPAGRGNKQDGLGKVVGGVLTLLAVGVFLASPLGSIVFAIFNSILAFVILAPIAAVVAFNVWQYATTISGNCPNCGSPVRVMKDQSPSFCFSCGSILQAKDDQIFIANLNNNLDYSVDDKVIVQDESSIGASWFDDISGVQRRPGTKSTVKRTIIDVEIESDDRKKMT